MKKIILVFVAIAITAGAYAQNDSTNKKMNMHDRNNRQNQDIQNSSFDKSHTDGVMMQNGKVMQMKNGQTTTLSKEVTLSNGTKITTDGTCIKKDGSKMMLKEGQHMDMSGNMIPMKTNKDKNMYVVPDSIKEKRQ